MKSLKYLLKSPAVLGMLAAVLLISLFFSLMVTGLLTRQNRDLGQMEELDWVFPLGTYDRIRVAEAEGKVAFLVESSSWSTDYYSELVDTEGKPAAYGWYLGGIKGNGLLELNIHPKGYYVKRNPNDSEHVQNLHGEPLTWFQYGSSLLLSETPGYAIETVTNRVLAIRQGDDITVYEPEDGERVIDQKGDYWIIEKSLPWPGNNLTVFYLRDMNFQIAMDGMLFGGIYDIDGDYIACEVITSGTYYKPPQEVVEVDWRIMTAEGEIFYSANASGDMSLLNAGTGYYFVMEDPETRKMYFYDGSGPLDFEKGTMPVGPCVDGLIRFKTEDGKYGIMNKDGEIVVQPLFDSMSYLHQNMAVVVYGEDFGVIRLKGGGAL